MRFDRFSWFGLALALFFLFPPAETQAVPLYSITYLGDLSDGSPAVAAWDINSMGQVTGYASTPDGLRPILWTPTTPNGTTGSMINLGVLPHPLSQSVRGRGINDYGQVVGASTSGTAFLWTPTSANGTTGSLINLGDLPGGGMSAEAWKINGYGQVVGSSSASSGTRAYLWSPAIPNGTTGAIVDLGDLAGGDDISQALGINALGQVVGQSGASTGQHAFLWSPGVPNSSSGTMVDLGDLNGGTDESFAVAISFAGQIVGHANEATMTGMIWTPDVPNGMTGSMIGIGGNDAGDINSSGWIIGTPRFLWTPDDGMMSIPTLIDGGVGWGLGGLIPTSINDFGQIVGVGSYDPDGPGGVSSHQSAFLLTPIPEPDRALVLSAGMLFFKRRG